MKEQQKVEERWRSYRLANSNYPEVRRAELKRQLELTNPRSGEEILEVGTGNGYLTFELAKAVGRNGKIITYDYQRPNLDFVDERNQGRYNIETVHQNQSYDLYLPDESVDKVSTIASLHHYDNRDQGTGTRGRQKIINEFYRVLKKEGKLILGDVAKGTRPQKYFDAVDTPIHTSPNGHPHDFLDEGLVRKLCQNAGFRSVDFSIENVDWEFRDEEQASRFLNGIHNARCSNEESLEMAKKHLSSYEKDEKFYLGWQLHYVIAQK